MSSLIAKYGETLRIYIFLHVLCPLKEIAVKYFNPQNSPLRTCMHIVPDADAHTPRLVEIVLVIWGIIEKCEADRHRGL